MELLTAENNEHSNSEKKVESKVRTIYIMHKGKIIFITFYLVHIIECMRNNLYKKSNYFYIKS